MNTITSLAKGLKITWRHFLNARTLRDPIAVSDDGYFDKKEGVVTLQYPFEEIPVPDNGRYKLHNEIDDCIVCDKCAKVCPVNCIDIEPVRAVEEIGKTSDGTPKRIYAAKFDIDMSKCCFCGLCTTVCPTECLTMSKEYDFSVFDITEHNFEFGEMDAPEIQEKKLELEAFNIKKAEAKAQKVVSTGETKSKPNFKPKVKTPEASTNDLKKPVFKPKIKTAEKKETEGAIKPIFKPKIKGVPSKETDKLKDSQETEIKSETDNVTKKKATFRPKIKPKVKAVESKKPEAQEEKKESVEGIDLPNDSAKEEKKKKPVFRPKIKPKK